MRRTRHPGKAMSSSLAGRATRASSYLFFVACFAAAAASCGGGSNSGHALSKGCAINSDCDSPLVCAFQTCHQQCDASRDCPDSELCVTSVRPNAVCQFPSEATCAYNSQCVPGEVCARDGHCRDQCTADRDCIAGQQCASGACANPAEVMADGTLAQSTSPDAGAGTACQLSSDCGDTGLVCRQGLLWPAMQSRYRLRAAQWPRWALRREPLRGWG